MRWEQWADGWRWPPFADGRSHGEGQLVETDSVARTYPFSAAPPSWRAGR
jgi:hypothetical protein